jgi:sulfide:quinone oxidoreductase
MEILKLTGSLSVAGQIDERDIDALAAAGFKAVICNRPDAEGGTPSQTIRAACERNAMKFFMQPVGYTGLGVADGDTFGGILQQCGRPVLAYCRSGRRTTALWAIAAAPFAGAQAVVERAARIGQSVEDLREVLARSAARADPPYAPSSDPAARERFVRLWVAPAA